MKYAEGENQRLAAEMYESLRAVRRGINTEKATNTTQAL